MAVRSPSLKFGTRLGPESIFVLYFLSSGTRVFPLRFLFRCGGFFMMGCLLMWISRGSESPLPPVAGAVATGIWNPWIICFLLALLGGLAGITSAIFLVFVVPPGLLWIFKAIGGMVTMVNRFGLFFSAWFLVSSAGTFSARGTRQYLKIFGWTPCPSFVVLGMMSF